MDLDVMTILCSEEAAKDVASGMSLDELFFLQDLKERKMFLVGEISNENVMGTIQQIFQINRQDKDLPVDARKPIVLYINSNGGDAWACDAMIDAIRTSITPVYTVNLGICYSAGFLIFVGGHKRFAMPSSTFLIHDGEMMTMNSMAKTHDFVDFSRRSEEKTKQYILSVSYVTEEEYDSKYRTEWYMFASDAKEKGFVDAIIGEDVMLSEIL